RHRTARRHRGVRRSADCLGVHAARDMKGKGGREWGMGDAQCSAGGGPGDARNPRAGRDANPKKGSAPHIGPNKTNPTTRYTLSRLSPPDIRHLNLAFVGLREPNLRISIVARLPCRQDRVAHGFVTRATAEERPEVVAFGGEETRVELSFGG